MEEKEIHKIVCRIPCSSSELAKLWVFQAFRRIWDGICGKPPWPGEIRFHGEKKQEVLECFTHKSQRSWLSFSCMGGISGRRNISAGHGTPAVIKTTGFSDLTDPVQKAACTQVVWERSRFTGSLMLAPINPARLTLLNQDIPDSLKAFVANF